MAFTMKGSPMKRNFGIGASPAKKTYKEAYLTRGKKYQDMDEATYIKEAKRQNIEEYNTTEPTKVYKTLTKEQKATSHAKGFIAKKKAQAKRDATGVDKKRNEAYAKAKKEAVLKRKEVIKVAAKKATVKSEHHQKDENGNTIPHEEEINELKSTTLLSYSQKAANQLAFKGDGGKKAQKRATGVKRAAGKLTMKAINKEEYDNTKSPDYEKKKKALAKKHGGADKIKGHPQYEDVNSTASVDYSGSPASTPPESAKAKRYPTFKDIQAKIAKAGDPSFILDLKYFLPFQ